MSITNISKPTTSLSNTSKVSIGETWATITTAWLSETRTWLAVSQLLTNQDRVTSVGIWSPNFYPWLETSPWTTPSYQAITNLPKP